MNEGSKLVKKKLHFCTIFIIVLAVVCTFERGSGASAGSSPFLFNSHNKRALLLDKIRGDLQVSQFLTVVPKLSPNEKRWLYKEKAAGGIRARKAILSHEFLINSVRENMENIDYLMKKIEKRDEWEFAYWADLAVQLLQESDLLKLIEICKKKVITPCPLNERIIKHPDLLVDGISKGAAMQIVSNILRAHVEPIPPKQID